MVTAVREWLERGVSSTMRDKERERERERERWGKNERKRKRVIVPEKSQQEFQMRSER